MKSFFLLFLAAGAVAFGSLPGDTYEKVIAEKGKPSSQMEAGRFRILSYPDVTIKIENEVVVAVSPVKTIKATSSIAAPALTNEAKRAALEKTEKAAILQVQRIVNQPVTAIERTPEMKVGEYGPVWFHPGAIKPDFANIDIRSSQALQYAKHRYVSSDLNPGVVFEGADLEFNPMTKYFYTDRSLPKKKLSESEMLEINRLYRIIGRSEQQLGELPAQ